MSGPKDYGIGYTIDRLAEFRRRNEAIQRARAEAVRATLDAARMNAFSRRRAGNAERDDALDAELSRRAEASRRAIEQANATASEKTNTPPAAPVEAVAEVAATDDSEQRAVIDGWTTALSADTAVTAFAAAEREAWTNRVGEANADLAALAAEGQAIHDRAGETQARFDTPNELLRDVIASLQEIGYFVSDPQLADPNDPAGPVVLKATCGSETVTTTVDLSDAIKSVWDGQELEHCKGTFFDYMDAMKARGVSVEPERADLRERPILKQKGMNELPTSGNHTEGR